VLFVDNLTAQQADQFKVAVASHGGVVWYGLKSAMDLWQVVDAGIAQTLKVLTGHNYQQWLDEENNVDLWHGHEKGLTAMERRTLITHWVGNAWKIMCGPEYANLRNRCWEKTGCLMTADGSHDDKITPEGLPNYKVPPPLIYLPACEAEPLCNLPDGEQDKENDEDIIEEDEEEPEDQGSEWLDNEEDRSRDDELCGRQIKALYENGWFMGQIEYFNKALAKYRVTYSDDSKDYIGIDVIDGVEIMLLD